jgi:hypothetical protein
MDGVVFVLNLAYDYEGEQTLGVFSSLELAWKSMQGHRELRGDEAELGDPRTGEIYPSPGSSSQYWIRETKIDEPMMK